MMDILATQVMRRSLQTVPANMKLIDLEHAFVQHGVSGFPVVDGEHLVGVVSRTDIVKQMDLEQQTAEHTSDYYRDANDELHEIPLSTTDQIADRVGERMAQLTVGDVMHRQIFAVRPDQPLRLIAEMMVEHKIHRVLVTLEGRLIGVVTSSDFVRLYAQGRIKMSEH
jgi:CBS domain-containing protein